MDIRFNKKREKNLKSPVGKYLGLPSGQHILGGYWVVGQSRVHGPGGVGGDGRGGVVGRRLV